MKEKGIGSILVRENERLVEIFTERDLLNRLIGGSRDLDGTLVANVMAEKVEALPVDDRFVFAPPLMGDGGY